MQVKARGVLDSGLLSLRPGLIQRLLTWNGLKWSKTHPNYVQNMSGPPCVCLYLCVVCVCGMHASVFLGPPQLLEGFQKDS